MMDAIRSAMTKLRGLITRVTVDRFQNGRYQVLWGARASDTIEHMQPQGIHFYVVSKGTGLLLAPGGNRDAGVIICASGKIPTDEIQEGEGGLHLMGEFKVFLKSDGTVSVGAYEASDFAARASRVDDEIAKIKQDLDGFKSKFDSHTHAGAFGGTGSAPANTTPPASDPAGTTPIQFPDPHEPETVASETVKIEP